MTTAQLWTDGSGTASGPIGWAWVLLAVNGRGQIVAERTGAGAFREGTNNRAELWAVIDGLLQLNRPTAVTVYTDSEYVCNPFRKGWLARWQENGWRTAQPPAGERPEAACPTCGAGGARGTVCDRHDPGAPLTAAYDRRMVRNRDLWQQLATASRLHRLAFEHVEGHAGSPLNEDCDRRAGEARRALVEQIKAAA